MQSETLLFEQSLKNLNSYFEKVALFGGSLVCFPAHADAMRSLKSTDDTRTGRYFSIQLLLVNLFTLGALLTVAIQSELYFLVITGTQKKPSTSDSSTILYISLDFHLFKVQKGIVVYQDKVLENRASFLFCLRHTLVSQYSRYNQKSKDDGKYNENLYENSKRDMDFTE